MNVLRQTLLSKQGKIVTELAALLLQFRPDERVPAIQEYAGQLDASVGTIQAALNQLQAHGAVKLESRGRLGAFVQAINYPLLWSLAHDRALIGALPLPYSRRLAGLATGVRQQFAGLPLNLELRFIRGAGTRLQQLQFQQCDWAIVSRYVAETATAHGFHLETVTLLGANSYTVGHVLLLNSENDTLVDGMRVGIDRNSIDQAFVVRAISQGRRVEFVDMDYSQGLELLDNGTIDATVWTQEDLPPTRDHLQIVPLAGQLGSTGELFGEAALLTRMENPGVMHLVKDLLETDRIQATQQAIVDRTMLPSY